MAGVAREIGLEQLPAWLAGINAALQTMTFEPVLKRQCTQVIVSAALENFAKAKGPDGRAWDPLTIRQGRPLHHFGFLSGSVTGQGPGHVHEVTPVSLTVGTNLDYASTHQPDDGRSETTIQAPAGKALAIPLTPTAARSRGPRSMQELQLVWPKGENAGWLEEPPKSSRGKPTVHFLLVKQVTVPARPFLGWNDDMAETCGQFIGEHTEEQLAKQ